MYPVPIVDELALYGAADRGVPSQERIILHATADVNLAQFVLCLGVKIGDSGSVHPINDHLFWLNEESVAAGTWIFVYTGPGTRLTTKTKETKEPAVVLHWNKPTTLFHEPHVIPVIFRIGGIMTEDLTAQRASERARFEAATQRLIAENEQRQRKSLFRFPPPKR